MVSNGDKWVRIFDISDVCKHRKGFTIYKVISMLYSEKCPEAITKITVWKRFNEFKKLHREIKVLHNKLKINDKYPTLPSSTFFKRFDNEIVQGRKEIILTFLEYVAEHPTLFSSHEFVKFFECSHSPNDSLDSNISSIRADLHLPEEPEYFTGHSDDDHTISDTESITASDILSDSQNLRSKVSFRSFDSASISTTTDSITLFDSQIYPTPPNTPSSVDNIPQYILDASIHVNIAVELENEEKYEEAFTAYKTAIDILLKFGKDDTNYDRKQMVRYRTDKYLIRAERIYNMFLASEVQNIKEITNTEENVEVNVQCVQRPLSDLYKYKVIRIISSGMLVLHSDLQKLYYIKVIQKTMKFLNENLILPESVPYMVKLHNYYNCENALFLVLEYCSGKRLWDYIRCRSENPNDVYYHSTDILRKVQEMDLSDAESECSYSDLINDYANNKAKGFGKEPQQELESQSSDESYEIVACVSTKQNITSIIDEPLNETKENAAGFQQVPNNEGSHITSRRVSEMSSFDETDMIYDFIVPMNEVVKWAAQLVLALEKLHALGIICYNIQSKNILINEEGDLRLTYMCNISEVTELFGKSDSVYAPDIYTFEPLTNSVDWWYFGAILYELLVGISLDEMHPDGFTSSCSLKIPKYVSPEGRSLLRQLLTPEPKQRLGFGFNGVEGLKSHPFFSSVSWVALLAKCL